MKLRKNTVRATGQTKTIIEHGTHGANGGTIGAIIIREIKAIRSTTLCETCGQTFGTRDKLLKHVAEIHRDESVKCANCGKTFKHKKNLTIHMKVHLRDLDTNTTIFYKCYLCSKRFELQEERTAHVRLSHKKDEKSLTCEDCSKTFTCESNLRRHRKTHHPGADGNSDSVHGPEIFECTVCQKKFKRKDSLKRHNDAQHTSSTSRPQFICDYCSRAFLAKCTLISHINVCKMKAAENLKFKCLHCDAAFCNDHLINQHYIQEHGIAFVYENLKFESFADFEAWRADLEEKTVTQFCNEHGWKTRTHFTKQYKCHRSGLRLAVPDENRKRFPKLSGSKKLDGICPAQIMMRENLEDGKCSVKYQKTHVGHNVCDQDELWFKRLSKEEALRNKRKPKTLNTQPEDEVVSEQKSERRARSTKVSKNRRKQERHREDTSLLQYQPVEYAEENSQDFKPDIMVVTSLEDEHSEKVLYDVSNITVITSLDVDHTERTLEDISNITVVASPEAEILIPSNDDDDSVRAFVEKHRDSILFYKGEGEHDTEHDLQDHDVVIVYMDQFQEEMLSRYAHECVAFDTTQGLSELYLHTMLIRDEEWEGIGVAFLLSNRCDQIVVDIFLSCVKENVGSLAPSIVMSDTSMTYQNTWAEKMTKPDYCYFCSWHVNKQWEEQLNEISNREKRKALKTRLYNLAQELNMDTFEEDLQSLLSDPDPDLVEFIRYFESYCAFTSQFWAYCYRPSSGINTNMSLESLYKMITGGLANGLKTGSVLECLNVFKAYTTTKEQQMQRKKLRGQIYDFEKAAILHKRHWLAERRSNTTIRTVNKMTWSIRSQENNGSVENYVVQKLKETDECKICDESRGLLRCSRCRICFHQFICTCRDCSMRCNMCKHIHALGLYLKDRTLAEEFVNFAYESEEEDESAYVVEEVMLSDDDLIDHDIEDVQIVNLDFQKEELLDEIVSCINGIQTEQSIEDLKKMWRKSVSSVVESSEIEDEKSSFAPDQYK